MCMCAPIHQHHRRTRWWRQLNASLTVRKVTDTSQAQRAVNAQAREMRIEIEILYAPQYTAVELTAVGLAAVGILAGDKGRTGSNATERNLLQLLDLVYYTAAREIGARWA